ncbi:MAG: inorganic diphosphatase, partial [Thermoanaerobaculum sp.]
MKVKGLDDKILAMAMDNPAIADCTYHGQLPAHTLREIKRFFQGYKALENKEVVVEEFIRPEEARGILRESLDLYRRLRRGGASPQSVNFELEHDPGAVLDAAVFKSEHLPAHFRHAF